jgi:sialate O-acetylesterase
MLLITIFTQAQVKIPSVFSDNMVLQQNSSVTIWGWASPQEKITVQASWGEKASTWTDENSKWSVKLKTVQAGGPVLMSW